MLLAVSWARGLCAPWVECIWSDETSSGSHPDHKRSRPPSSTVLDAYSTVSAGARNGSVYVSWFTRCTRVRSSNLSTQLRRTKTWSTDTLSVPTTVANFRQSADSAQVQVATIALHTEQEDTRNLKEVHVSFNDKPFYSLRVSHLLLWVDLHFCHNCYSPW